jgi:maleylacetate reductase
LGLPSHLSEVGVTKEKFELIGRNAMLSIFTRANPRVIRGAEDIVEILQLAA